MEGFGIPQPTMTDISKVVKDRGKEIRENERITREFQNKSVDLLDRIEQNTSVLRNIHDLLQADKERQDETLNLIAEILAVMKAADKQEAQTMFAKVMEKVNRFSSNAETMFKLYSLAHTVLGLVHSAHP